MIATTRDRKWSLLIGGNLVPAGTGATYPNASPVTGDVIADVPDADAADVETAVLAAKAAFPVWAATPVRERAAVLRQIAAILRENATELGELDTIDGGNIIRLSTGDVHAGAAMIDYFADLAHQATGETIPFSSNELHYTIRQPIGVVARIIPYNHPIMFAAGKIAAPLAAGNCVILKAPHQTPLSALRLGELVAGVLPPGVLSILSGSGPATGEAIVTHPAIRRIAFIGSAPTGMRIQRAAAEVAVKQVSLELGGKNALVAFADADPAEVAAAAVRGMNFSWAGQSCGSTSRLVVHADIHDATVGEIKKQVDALRIGDPFDQETDVGALVSKEQFDKVTRYLELGHAEGAIAATGGAPVTIPGRESALCVPPTVFTNVRQDMRIASEEIFGPVLSVLPFNDEAEAIELANAVEYGLTGSVWTNDLNRAHRVASALEVGYVWINNSSQHFVGTPFGGVKSSGIGREECLEELLSFTETKAVHLTFDRR
ncbi:MAG TPA: aldehyde dehydrogenase family protein [Pseudonocardiaceae bacterium]